MREKAFYSGVAGYDVWNSPPRVTLMANNTAPQSSSCPQRRRVLVAAPDAVRKPYQTLRGPALFRTWDVLEADSFEQAHFALQMDHCDVLLLDGSLFQPADEGLPW